MYGTSPMGTPQPHKSNQVKTRLWKVVFGTRTHNRRVYKTYRKKFYLKVKDDYWRTKTKNNWIS